MGADNQNLSVSIDRANYRKLKAVGALKGDVTLDIDSSLGEYCLTDIKNIRPSREYNIRNTKSAGKLL